MASGPPFEDDDRDAAHGGNGLVLALVLDGHGGARETDRRGVDSWQERDGSLWIHLAAGSEGARNWLAHRSGLAPSAIESLELEERRTRYEMYDGGAVLSLHGVPLDESDDDGSETVWSAWVDRKRLISLSARSLPMLSHNRRLLSEGRGPRDVADLLLQSATHLVERINIRVRSLEEPMAQLEFEVDRDPSAAPHALRDVERAITRLRRDTAPLKVLISRVLSEEGQVVSSGRTRPWRRLGARIDDADAELQSLHDRARVIHETFAEQSARRTNYILYVLTLLSGIMLPLTFLTGLFGMNVGIEGGSFPFLRTTWAFWWVCAALVVIAWLEYKFMKRRNMF